MPKSPSPSARKSPSRQTGASRHAGWSDLVRLGNRLLIGLRCDLPDQEVSVHLRLKELNLPDREDFLASRRGEDYIFPIGKFAMIDDAKLFGEMVAAARKRLGLTQRDLALAINTGERFIVELEGGKATAQLGKALAAARAVGLRLLDAPPAPGAPYGARR